MSGLASGRFFTVLVSWIRKLSIGRILASIWFSYRKIWFGILGFSIFLGVMTVFSLEENGYARGVDAWDGAEWISNGGDDAGPVSYYRYSLVLQTTPDSSFLKVSATGSFTVYVNGKEVIKQNAPSTRPVVIGMPTDALKSGKNVIAIRVEKKTTTGRPELLFSMSVDDVYTGTTNYISNESWLVSSVPGNSTSLKFQWFEELFDDGLWHAAIKSSSNVVPAMPDNLPAELASGKALIDFTPIWHAYPEITQAHLKTSLPFKRNKLLNAWLMLKCNGEYRVAVNGVGVGNYYSENSTIRLINIFQYLTSSHVNYIDVSAECGFGEGINLKAFLELDDHQIVSIPSREWRLYPYDDIKLDSNAVLEDPYIVVTQTSPEVDRIRKLTGGLATLEVIDENHSVLFGLKFIKWAFFWAFLFSAFNALLLIKMGTDRPFIHEVNTVFVILTLVGGLCMYWLLDERIDFHRFYNLLNVSFFALLCIILELLLVYGRGGFQHFFSSKNTPLADAEVNNAG